MAEFFIMGGYAAFVWPAFGLAILVMAALFIQSDWTLHAREAELEALHRDSERAGKPTHDPET